MFEVVRRRLGEWGDRHFISLSASMLTLMILLFFCLPRMVITIPAGHGGALWLRFFGGTDRPFTKIEGKEFTRIPCMNEHPLWIAALENMAKKFLTA